MPTTWYGGPAGEVLVDEQSRPQAGLELDLFTDELLTTPATGLINAAGDAVGNTPAAGPAGKVKFGDPSGQMRVLYSPARYKTVAGVVQPDPAGGAFEWRPDPAQAFAAVVDDTPTGANAGATPATGRTLMSYSGGFPVRVMRQLTRAARRVSTFKPYTDVITYDDYYSQGYRGDGYTEERLLPRQYRLLVARLPTVGNNRTLLEDLDGEAAELKMGIALGISPKTERPYNISGGASAFDGTGDHTFSDGVPILGGGIDFTTIRNTVGAVKFGKTSGFMNKEAARSFPLIQGLTIDRFQSGPVGVWFGWLSRGVIDALCVTGCRAPDTANGEDARLQAMMIAMAQNLEFRHLEIRNNSTKVVNGVTIPGGGGLGGTMGASNLSFYHRVIRDNDGWGERYWWQAPPEQIAITQGHTRNWRAKDGLTEDNGSGDVLIESAQAHRWRDHQLSLPRTQIVGGTVDPGTGLVVGGTPAAQPPVFAMVNTQPDKPMGPFFWDGSGKGPGRAADGNQYGNVFVVERGTLVTDHSLIRNAENLYVIGNLGRVKTTDKVLLANSVKSEGRPMVAGDSPTGTATVGTRPFRTLVTRNGKRRAALTADTPTNGLTVVTLPGMIFDLAANEEIEGWGWVDHSGDPANDLQISWLLPNGTSVPAKVVWSHDGMVTGSTTEASTIQRPVSTTTLTAGTIATPTRTRFQFTLTGADTSGTAQLRARIGAGTMTGTTQTTVLASSRMWAELAGSAVATESDGGGDD